MKMPLESWFQDLCTLSSHDLAILDHDIQKINEMIFGAFCATRKCQSSTSRKQSIAFQKKIHDELVAKDLRTKLIKVAVLQDQRGLAHLLITLTRQLLEKVIELSKA